MIAPVHQFLKQYQQLNFCTLRNELLNAERFCTAHQAESAVNIWLHQYNHIKPHHRLNIRPRVPETLIEKTKISGPEN